ISLTWVFKAVYPLLFALVPLGLFTTVRTQRNDKIAFLSAFFVSSLFTFYGEMPALARQEIAELFFILLLLLTARTPRPTERLTVGVLYAVFAASLVVSHYALAFIYLAYVIIAWLLLFLVDNPALRRLGPSTSFVFIERSRSPRRMLTPMFILPLAAFTGIWYLSAGSAALTGINQALNSWGVTALTPRTVAGAVIIGAIAYGSALAIVYLIARRGEQEEGATARLHVLTPFILLAALGSSLVGYLGVALSDFLPPGLSLSPLHALGLVMYVLSVLLIVIGFVALVSNRVRGHFNFEYVALGLASFILLAVATIVPQLAFSLNTTRLFHISMLLLAPFCVIGGLFVAQPLALRMNARRGAIGKSLAQKLVAVFFVVLFLFSTGFVYEVTQQGSTAFILNSAVDAPRFNEREVAAAQWMSLVRGSVAGKYLLPVYADAHRRALFDSIDMSHPATALPTPLNKTPSYAYVYLGTYNLKTASVAQMSAKTLLGGTGIQYVALDNTTTVHNKIFDDGGAAIYL
ncbi:MAG: DUF2206 domain-containing protein, partial [Halobacteriota archaeon]